MSIPVSKVDPAILPKSLKLYINGEFVDSVSGKKFDVIRPSTEEVLCQVSEADKADIEKAVDAAEAALNGEWKKIGNAGRQQCLLKLADMWEKHAAYLAELECLNNGTPIAQTKPGIEGLANEIRYWAGWCDKALDGRTVSVDGPFTVMTQREPYGVCGLILAWNLPCWNLIVKMAPALALGNTIVAKPAEQTPLTALVVASWLNECGFPKGVVNIVPGFGPTAGAAIASHPRINKLAFTGSTDVGRIVMKSAADSNLKQVQLELGGKSPVVVFPDADLDSAVSVCANSIFSNNGEQCDAGSRTFVHEDVYDEFVKKMTAKAATLKIGDSQDYSTDVGPLVDKQQHEKVQFYIDLGKKEGATCAFGGEKINQNGYWVQPTIFTNVTDDMRIAKEEIFGPVQSILKWKDVKDVIKRCNNTTYGLAGAVCTKNIENVFTFTKNVRAGFLWVNTYFQMFPAAEFGGFKQSGIGKEGGGLAVQEWSVSKTVVISTPSEL